MSTDKDWEDWGADNPYFGVLSDPKFLGHKLNTSELADEFYRSGIGDISLVMRHVSTLKGPKRFSHAIDFGCGVGRLTVPLSKYADRVSGLDVSPSIIKTANKTTPKAFKKKIKYIVSNDALDNLPKQYDLVHSFIVLQHIPPSRGEIIIKKLVDGLTDGGFIALHVTYAYNAPRFKKLVIWARNHFVPLHYLLNLIKGNPLTMPRMRMHTYDLNNIMQIINKSGVSETMQTTTDHGGYIGVMIIGKKIVPPSK